MKFLESLIYGFVSGICEILPVSSRAHQGIMLKLFGVSEVNPILSLMVHLSILAAVLFSCRNLVDQLRNRQTYGKRTRRIHYNTNFRFIKNATISLAIGIVLLTYTTNTTPTLPKIAIFSLVNGIVLFLPARMMQGNKDTVDMSAIDSITIGIFGATSVIPGISRFAIMTSYASMRGVDKEKSLNLALLLSIPALFISVLFDFFALFGGMQAVSFGLFMGYILAMGVAFIACYFASVFMRFLSVRTGYSGFAFYSWGLALFSFVLYLI